MTAKEHCLRRGCREETKGPHFFCPAHRDAWHSSDEVRAFVDKELTFSEAINSFNDRELGARWVVEGGAAETVLYASLTCSAIVAFVAMMAVAASVVTP